MLDGRRVYVSINSLVQSGCGGNRVFVLSECGFNPIVAHPTSSEDTFV